MIDVGGEYLLVEQGIHLDKILRLSLTIQIGSLSSQELISLSWRVLIGARLVTRLNPCIKKKNYCVPLVIYILMKTGKECGDGIQRAKLLLPVWKHGSNS